MSEDRGPAVKTVEELNAYIDLLTMERQQLRSVAADAKALETNRIAIAEAQWQLSYALIDRYVSTPAADAA